METWDRQISGAHWPAQVALAASPMPAERLYLKRQCGWYPRNDAQGWFSGLCMHSTDIYAHAKLSICITVYMCCILCVGITYWFATSLLPFLLPASVSSLARFTCEQTQCRELYTSEEWRKGHEWESRVLREGCVQSQSTLEVTDRSVYDSAELSNPSPPSPGWIRRLASPSWHLLEGELFIVWLDASNIVWRCGVQGLHKQV